MRHSLQRSTFKTSEGNQLKIKPPPPMKKTNSQKFKLNNVGEQTKESPTKLKIHKSGIPLSVSSISRLDSMKSRNFTNKLPQAGANSELFNKEFYFTEKFMSMKSPVMSYYHQESTPDKKEPESPFKNKKDDSFFYKRSDSELSNKNSRGLAFRINSTFVINNPKLSKLDK